MLSINKKLSGRKRIELNITKEDFLQNPEEALKNLMGNAISIHNQNKIEFDYIDLQLKGEQDIYNKTRTDTSKINNKFVENHLYRLWKFKKSYIVGRPIQYSDKNGNDSDMTYFNRYIQDSGKSSNDILIYGDIYEYGVAYRMQLPKRNDFDSKWESPTRDIYLDPRDVFVAYSSSYDKEELFGCIIDKYYEFKTKKKKTRYTIYFTDEQNRCNSIQIDGRYDVIGKLQVEAYKNNPIFEYTLPKRIGILEVVISLQNALNYNSSLQFDDIEQFIQSYLVFINQDIDLESDEGQAQWKANLKLFNETRALVLKSINEQMPADFKVVSNSLDHNAINEIHNRLENAIYNITGTPKTSGNVTSGGDTTGARMLGNGWETALNDAEVDTTFFKKSEYKWLKFLLDECKTSGNNKLETILPSEIEIKYNINMSDNILVKSQAIMNMKSAKMPNDLILTTIPLISDSYGSAKKWTDYEEKLLKEGMKNDNKLDMSQMKKVTNNDINDQINKSNV